VCSRLQQQQQNLKHTTWHLQAPRHALVGNSLVNSRHWIKTRSKSAQLKKLHDIVCSHRGTKDTEREQYSDNSADWCLAEAYKLQKLTKHQTALFSLVSVFSRISSSFMSASFKISVNRIMTWGISDHIQHCPQHTWPVTHVCSAVYK